MLVPNVVGTDVSVEATPVLVSVPLPPVDRVMVPLADGSTVEVVICDRVGNGAVVEFSEHVGPVEGSGIDVVLW